MITPTRHKNLYEEISNQIIAMISDGRWKEGERIPGEIELSGLFEVSRNSVRESIKALELLGLLKARSGSGTYVSAQALLKISQMKYSDLLGDESSFVEMMEARVVIEPGLARMVAENATEADIAGLREVLDANQKAFDQKNYGFERGLVFHYTLYRISGNRVLIGMFENMKGNLIAVRRKIFFRHGDEKILREELREHGAILDLIASGKGPQAESLMRLHLVESLSRLKKKQKQAFGAGTVRA